MTDQYSHVDDILFEPPATPFTAGMDRMVLDIVQGLPEDDSVRTHFETESDYSLEDLDKEFGGEINYLVGELFARVGGIVAVYFTGKLIYEGIQKLF